MEIALRSVKIFMFIYIYGYEFSESKNQVTKI